MIKSNDDLTNVRTVIGLTKVFKREVIAEAVETVTDSAKAVLVLFTLYVPLIFLNGSIARKLVIDGWHVALIKLSDPFTMPYWISHSLVGV